MKPRLFVFGLGYVGLRVAREALACGYEVSGSVRHGCDAQARLNALATLGIAGCTFDLDESYGGLSDFGVEQLRRATHVLGTVPPVADLDRDPLLELHMKDLLDTIEKGDLRWAGYLSTTGVYGDHGGDWVDETSETRGVGSGPRLRAEDGWLSLSNVGERTIRARVFRLAGIYGPGRSALDVVAKASEMYTVPPGTPDPGTNGWGRQLGTSSISAASATLQVPDVDGDHSCLDSPPPRFVSRIHVDDVVRTLICSIDAAMPSDSKPLSPQGNPPCVDAYTVYNVADDAPAPRMEVMRYAWQLMGEPKETSFTMLEGTGKRARRRASENKRVRNRRMRELLGTQGLLFPDYKMGLEAIKFGAGRDH
mmetsp:Transcript_369/g.1195  ORF Transcript_369/g.1195 Transcript_369/m.1195 type:complete len:366 (+) Transcript_369:2-1099(+)|eukprot:scaffold297297_cov35-Tisochrysis_lutea.AAC.1